jgi:hypothetical protein
MKSNSSRLTKEEDLLAFLVLARGAGWIFLCLFLNLGGRVLSRKHRLSPSGLWFFSPERDGEDELSVKLGGIPVTGEAVRGLSGACEMRGVRVLAFLVTFIFLHLRRSGGQC